VNKKKRKLFCCFFFFLNQQLKGTKNSDVYYVWQKDKQHKPCKTTKQVYLFFFRSLAPNAEGKEN